MSKRSYHLSPWPLVKQSIHTATDNLSYVIHIGWVGFTIICLLTLFGSALGVSKNFFAGLVLYFLNALALAPFAVAWHRFILLGEVVKERAYFQFDNRVLSYALYAFAVESLINLGIVVVGFLQKALHLPMEVAAGLFIAGFIISLYFTLRLSLAFPAIAIGKPGAGLISSYEATRGNGFALILAAFFASLLLIVVIFLVVAVPTLMSTLMFGGNQIGSLLAILAIIPLAIIVTAAYLAFYSHCFVLLYEQEQSDQGQNSVR